MPKITADLLSVRSRLSLCQFLTLHLDQTQFLFPKYGIEGLSLGSPDIIGDLKDRIITAPHEKVAALLEELVKTQGYLRVHTNPRYMHDQRWAELSGSLEIDGYRIDGPKLVRIDSATQEAVEQESELLTKLKNLFPDNGTRLGSLLEESAQAFRSLKPDYNGCLSKIRVALEEVAALAAGMTASQPVDLSKPRWGPALAALRADLKTSAA